MSRFSTYSSDSEQSVPHNEARLVLPTEEDVYLQITSKAHPDWDNVLVDKFLNAINLGDLETVRNCLDDGVPINCYDLSGRTILHLAAASGSVEMTRLAVRWPRINLNTHTFDFSLTPLHVAVLTSRDEIVEILLEAGAKINLTNGNGITAAHMAVRNSDVPILMLLLRYDAKLNVVDSFSNTPLSIAILDIQNYNIAWILLKHGANVNMKRPHAMYLFHEATLNCLNPNDMDFVQLLVVHGARKNFVDKNGRNALHYASITGIPMLVKYLLDVGVNPNTKDKTDRTPFDIASQHGHEDAVHMFQVFASRLSDTPAVKH